jgi:hypothetical protein
MPAKPISLTPMRFFGPISRSQAESVAELMLDDEQTGLKDTLIRYMTAADSMTPRELAYEVQMLMESHFERLTSAENYDYYKDEEHA